MNKREEVPAERVQEVIEHFLLLTDEYPEHLGGRSEITRAIYTAYGEAISSKELSAAFEVLGVEKNEQGNYVAADWFRFKRYNLWQEIIAMFKMYYVDMAMKDDQVVVNFSLDVAGIVCDNIQKMTILYKDVDYIFYTHAYRHQLYIQFRDKDAARTYLYKLKGIAADIPAAILDPDNLGRYRRKVEDSG